MGSSHSQSVCPRFRKQGKTGRTGPYRKTVTECGASEFEKDERLRARAVIWLANQMALPEEERVKAWPVTSSWDSCGKTPEAFFCGSTSNSIRICLPELWDAIKNGIRRNTPGISSVYTMAAISVEATRLYYKEV
jgi:hypothetical protein